MNICPDSEHLAAYLEQQLSTEENERLKLHFLNCQICRRILARVIKSESKVPEPKITNKLSS